MKLFPAVITLLLASSFLIVGCSDSSEKKVTFPIPASDKVEVEDFGLDVETRQKIFSLLVDAEQRASKEALALFPSLDKSNTEPGFREKLEELKASYYSEILTANKLAPNVGDVILIEGIKANWADISNSKQINKERIEVPAKNNGPKKIPVKVKTEK
jgi:hypothetical protein